MSSRFKTLPFEPVSRSDAETVAALVAMLSGMGINRARIDAMINKTARPEKAARSFSVPDNLNEDRRSEPSRRSA